MRPLKRATDLLSEILVGIILVIGFVAYLFMLQKGTTLNWQRIALVVNTLMIFGFLISWFKDQWNRLVFWATIAALLLGHVAAYILLLGHINGWPLAFYVVLNLIELAVFAPILAKIARNPSRT
jgi:hypothetical protein